MCRQITIILICLTTVQSVIAKNPSALELLDKYAETQGKLQSFILKCKDSNKSTRPFSPQIFTMNRSCEVRFDGERCCIRELQWGHWAPGRFTPKDNPEYVSILWDGEHRFQYSRNKRGAKHDDLFISTKSAKETREMSARFGGASLMGLMHGDGERRVDSILRKARNIRVQDKMERVRGSRCYVVYAVTRRGKYTLWIDPQHGYHIAKAMIKRGENDLFGDWTMEKGYDYSYSVKNVRFKKVDDIWVPMEADINGNQRRPKGASTWFKLHHKVTEITLHPDHDALGSFIPDDIRNGAEVSINGLDDKYRWLNGQVVDKQGRKVHYK